MLNSVNDCLKTVCYSININKLQSVLVFNYVCWEWQINTSAHSKQSIFNHVQTWVLISSLKFKIGSLTTLSW